MKNKTIRDAAARAGVKLWEIAQKMNLSDGNFSRKLRNELPEDEQKYILCLISEIAAEHQEAI